MTRPLLVVPHEVPFRAAASASKISATEIEGTYLCTTNDALTAAGVMPVMVVEAMAQIAGALVFTDASEPAFLSAISDVRFQLPVEPGDLLSLRVTAEGEFGGVHRFHGIAAREGLEVTTARFYLASQKKEEPPATTS